MPLGSFQAQDGSGAPLTIIAARDGSNNAASGAMLVDPDGAPVSGGPAETPAPADGTGNYTILGALKRSLLNGAAILARLPVLGQAAMAGSVPVAIAANQTPVPVTGGAVLTANPPAEAAGQVVRQAPCDVWSVSFAGSSGSALIAPELTQRRQGTGVTVSQASSNLVIGAGTSANQEYLARSARSFRGALIARHRLIASQRIANNNLAIMLADRVAEGAAVTVNSATSISVTLVGHGLDAANVGQFMFVGAVNGVAGVPGRYAIASVPDGNTINFTVAGWPASGSGTVDLFGWNYVRTLYTGTTATNAAVDAQRRGWASGDSTATINTTASPGHMVQTQLDGRNVYWSDALVASATTPTVTTRASRVENIPDDDVELFFYVWSWNGTTNPASNTNWTIGFLAVEDTTNQAIYLAGVRPLGNAAAIPITGAGSFTVAQATAANLQATATLAAGTAQVGDVGGAYRGNATGAASVANVNAPATPVAQSIKAAAGRLVGGALTNTSASPRYVKFYNTASVTVGTTAAAFEIAIPANGMLPLDSFGGLGFATAIQIAITGARGLTDNTAITAGDVTGFLAFA